ncbi:nicotinamide riboside transporter PnuC [Fulvivirga ulvae]|uniref:nicotinamide riboside transporter PnuC n=1 Tax=Fulvivirga ulvae TaxID=2904245 RepID=UPI001F231746|nr:nicotinamide riboside transporter PnuC [Fulvivirga ulvae]UII31064.1 nicotinamide riboside transporter PnuC [Fulvivirga ulvae]
MDFFDINNIAFEVLGYPLSYIELAGTLFGFISVVLAAKPSVLTWPTGIVNEAAFFILFYQVQLYSDMYLQFFFFGVTVYGWYYWKKQDNEASVKKLTNRWRLIYLTVLMAGSVLSGLLMTQIHLLFPLVFTKPASYPFADAFTTTASILATILLSRKRIETWILWILVDMVSVTLYFLKGIHLVAIEYVVFLVICMIGYFNWRSKL